MVKDAKALADSLEKNIPSDSKIFYKYFAEENHATILHTSIYAAFIKLNKK